MSVDSIKTIAKMLSSRPTTRLRKILTLGFDNWETTWNIGGDVAIVRTFTEGGGWTHLKMEERLKLASFSLNIICSDENCQKERFPFLTGIPRCFEHRDIVFTTCNDKGEK